MDKLSYALGVNIGSQLHDMGLHGEIDAASFAAAVNDILSHRDLQYTPEEINKTLDVFFSDLEKKHKQASAEAGKAAKEDGEKFLADNAKRDGVVVTPSGLQYEIISEGSGAQPNATDTVRCHYHGTLTNGAVFDSSYQRGEPAEFGLSQVIKGWTEGLQLMKEGAKYRFYIPYHLAYGERGAGHVIAPYSALIFEVELLKVL